MKSTSTGLRLWLLIGGLVLCVAFWGCSDGDTKSKDKDKKDKSGEHKDDDHDHDGDDHDHDGDDHDHDHDGDGKKDHDHDGDDHDHKDGDKDGDHKDGDHKDGDEKNTSANQSTAKEKSDWIMWGGTPSRNMVSSFKGKMNLDFDLTAKKNVKWIAQLGSQTYGNPVVADGKIYVGTNNGAEYRPKHKQIKEGDKIVDDGDRGVLICFNEEDGKFLWQLTRKKLEIGRVQDWMLQGICSVPCIEGDRMWVVTNRCELMCLDTNGFYDDENDGEIKDEVDNEKLDADIVWSLDMINELGVFPHNLATSSPVLVGDNIYLLTSNGVDEAHLELPSPRAPSFLCVNKKTGKVVWEKRYPKKNILHGQWSSPAVGVVNGQTQVYFPGGDGVLYALDPKDGSIIWQFDLNPKETVWELGGAGTRNAIISTPVFYENSVILGVGQDPEHGEGVGHMYRIDATKKGDISPEVGDIGKKGEKNPNSGVIWHYGGVDEDGSVTGEKGAEVFHRTMSTVSITNNMVFIADLSGRVHCIDFKTGKRLWLHDLYSEIWGSTMAVQDTVWLGNGEGTVTVFKASKDKAEVIKKYDTQDYSSVYSTPTIANGMMYLSDRSKLYAIELETKEEK